MYNNSDIIGLEVEVYRNLTKNCYSVRHKGKVISHEDEVILAAPICRVQPAGRARVLKEKRKNVHAYVKGVIIAIPTEYPFREENMVKVRYNPYEKDHFFRADTQSRVDQGGVMWLNENGMFIHSNNGEYNAA